MSGYGPLCVAYLAGLAVGLMVGIAVGASHTQGKSREEAITAGVAHWTIDPQTGERSFRYITMIPHPELE